MFTRLEFNNKFYFIGRCIDTDNGKKDKDDYSCKDYKQKWCGKADDDDFKSNDMCCICYKATPYTHKVINKGGSYKASRKII